MSLAQRHDGRSTIRTVTTGALVIGLAFVFLAAPAHADPCPGSDTCPENQVAFAQGPNAAEVKWTEPDQLPVVYNVTSNPPAPNQPVSFQTVSPNDWEDRLIFGLQPNTKYVFTICGYYSPANQSCVTTNAITTLPPSQGGGTPTPIITNVNPTTNSITIFWNGGQNYDVYQTIIDGVTQAPIAGGTAGSYLFAGLQPGTVYTVGVQGGLNNGWGHTWSSWATIKVATIPLPPLPAIAPQNLHTVNSGSQIEILWTDAASNVDNSNIARAPGWAQPTQAQWLNSTAVNDIAAVPGQLYTYQVCLTYWNRSGTACASTTGALPPTCSVTFSCPYATYTPPDYLVQCSGRADFYFKSPAGTMTSLGTDTKVSGTTSDYSNAIVACASGTQAASSCASFGIGMGPQGWCAPAPPAPQPRPNCCAACVKAGGSCNVGPHGCTCF